MTEVLLELDEVEDTTFKTANLVFGTDLTSSDKGKVPVVVKKVNAILMVIELALLVPFGFVTLELLAR